MQLVSDEKTSIPILRSCLHNLSCKRSCDFEQDKPKKQYLCPISTEKLLKHTEGFHSGLVELKDCMDLK